MDTKLVPQLRFVFDRKHLATKSSSSNPSKGLVQIELRYGGERKFISTGVKVYSDQWNESKKVVNSLDSDSLNRVLLSMERSINSIIAGLLDSGKDLSLKMIMSSLERKGASRQDFIKFCYDMCETLDISEHTRVYYRQHIGYAEKYGKFGKLSDVDQMSIIRFNDWLKTYEGKRGRLETSTIFVINTTIKYLLKLAYERKLISEFPYNGLKQKSGRKDDIKYLTKDELSVLASAKLKLKSHDRVRDLFLFQTMTCLSYVDMAKIDFTKDITEENGKFIIHDKRTKTAENYNIVLIPEAMRILKKYNMKLPICCISNYDNRLRDVSKKLGLPKITSHWARHTGAVLALNNDIPIEVVSKMLGHSNIKTTQVYAKVLAKTVESAYEKVADFWSKM